MEYVDFEVEIRAPQEGAHPVVVRSPAGEARGSLRLPLAPLELENRLQALQIALLRSGTTRRRIASGEEQTVQTFGQELFAALFHDEILSKFDSSRFNAKRDRKGLRIKLRFESPELAALPWEYLFDAREADYLSRSIKTPLVRYIELSHPVDPLRVTPPLRILGLVVSPVDLDPLDVEHEQRRVEEAIGGLVAEGRFELQWLRGHTPEALQRELELSSWHIFHFVGHGGYDANADEGLIVLADERGRSRPLPASQLASLLGDHDSMRLAVLNSCESARGGAADIFSSTAAAILRRGTPAVVAMQYEITDIAAINFSRSFYTSIADGLPVDAAVSQARKGIWLAQPASLEWGTPVLHMHARDGLLFDLPSVPSPARPAASPGPTAEGAVERRPVAEGATVTPQGVEAPAPVAPIPVAPVVEPVPTPQPVTQSSGRKFCTQCGLRLFPGNRFCTGCGRPTG